MSTACRGHGYKPCMGETLRSLVFRQDFLCPAEDPHDEVYRWLLLLERRLASVQVAQHGTASRTARKNAESASQ